MSQNAQTKTYKLSAHYVNGYFSIYQF